MRKQQNKGNHKKNGKYAQQSELSTSQAKVNIECISILGYYYIFPECLLCLWNDIAMFTWIRTPGCSSRTIFSPCSSILLINTTFFLNSLCHKIWTIKILPFTSYRNTKIVWQHEITTMHVFPDLLVKICHLYRLYAIKNKYTSFQIKPQKLFEFINLHFTSKRP